MWSDPIDNALSNALGFLERLSKDTPFEESELQWQIGALKRAEKARNFEKENDRLVTPEDRY